MPTKESILAYIEDLKRDKPPAWKRTALKLIGQIREMEDPYRGLEYHGAEANGRTTRSAKAEYLEVKYRRRNFGRSGRE